MTEELVLITPPGRPLPAGALSLDQVREEPFVCLAAGGLHAILLEAAEAAGFEPRIQFETYRPASIRELVATGLGVALLAASNARGQGPRVQVHQLVRPPTHPPIGLICLPSREPVIRARRAHVGQAHAAG